MSQQKETLVGNGLQIKEIQQVEALVNCGIANTIVVQEKTADWTEAALPAGTQQYRNRVVFVVEIDGKRFVSAPEYCPDGWHIPKAISTKTN